jgi:hypothetical protein
MSLPCGHVNSIWQPELFFVDSYLDQIIDEKIIEPTIFTAHFYK